MGVTGCVVAAVIWLFRLRLRGGQHSAPRTRAGGSRRNAASNPPAVAFYRRLETLLARWGHVQSIAQTPQEFAEQAAERIAAACGDGEVTDGARQIVQAFYEVRFGAATLAGDRAAVVEAALRRITQVARRNSAAPPAALPGKPPTGPPA